MGRKTKKTHPKLKHPTAHAAAGKLKLDFVSWLVVLIGMLTNPGSRGRLDLSQLPLPAQAWNDACSDTATTTSPAQVCPGFLLKMLIKAPTLSKLRGISSILHMRN